MAPSRSSRFQRNPELEQLLSTLNSALAGAEKNFINGYKVAQPRFPIVFVMGPLRSGTTLFMQWLAAMGSFGYPSNFLSRFYSAPALGALIQQMLVDKKYEFRDELADVPQSSSYGSENGKTSGFLGVNEFWYFWRRFLPRPEEDVFTDRELEQGFDRLGMLQELSALVDIFDRPFAAKGMLFNANVPYLDKVLDRVVFVRMLRDPIATVGSVLKARVKQYGSVESWYSFRIREYEQLVSLDPLSQVAAQIAYINAALDKGLSCVASDRKLTVSYEAFCSEPSATYEELREKVRVMGAPFDAEYTGPRCFTPSTNHGLSDSEVDTVREVMDQIRHDRSSG